MPAKPESFLPILPTNFGKYRYLKASPDAGISSTTYSNSFACMISSIFNNENNWVIPGSIATSYARVSSIPFVENIDAT
jgi:hypothetical protein